MGPVFKDIAFQDISNVFFNFEEFAEEHDVNGKKMMIIVDSMEAERRTRKQFEKLRIDGVSVNVILIYVARKDFGQAPAQGRRLMLDGRPYVVEDVIDEGGVLSIELRAFVS